MQQETPPVRVSYVADPKGAAVTTPAHEALRSAFEDALANQDRAAAVRAVTSAVREGRIALDDVYARVLTPLLIDIGASWAAGTTAVWEEHFASSVVRTVIESLATDVSEAAAAVPARGTVVLACPSGEQHDLGLRMLADRLALRGWKAHFLGADTPAEEVIAAAKALGADMVALSAATHYNLVLLRAFVDQVKAGLPGVQIGVGGPAFACNHQWPADDLLVLHDLGIEDDPSGACDLPDERA